MKKCLKCGKVVPSNEDKCPYCNTNLKSLDFCPKCNAKLEPNSEFCSNCGQPLYTTCLFCRKKIVGSPDKCPYCGVLILQK